MVGKHIIVGWYRWKCEGVLKLLGTSFRKGVCIYSIELDSQAHRYCMRVICNQTVRRSAQPITTQCQCRKEKCIVIKPLVTDQGHRKGLGAELRPWARVLSTKSQKATVPSYSYFSTNRDSGIGHFPRNISLWCIYPVLVGWFAQLRQDDLSSIQVSTCQPGCCSSREVLGTFLDPYSKWKFYSKCLLFGSLQTEGPRV